MRLICSIAICLCSARASSAAFLICLCSASVHRLTSLCSRVSLNIPIALGLGPTANPWFASHASRIRPTTSSVPACTTLILMSSLPRPRPPLPAHAVRPSKYFSHRRHLIGTNRNPPPDRTRVHDLLCRVQTTIGLPVIFVDRLCT
jgi:hypothetical protein